MRLPIVHNNNIIIIGEQHLMTVIVRAHDYGNAEKLKSDQSLQDLGACTTRFMRSYTRPSFPQRLKGVACETTL